MSSSAKPFRAIEFGIVPITNEARDAGKVKRFACWKTSIPTRLNRTQESGLGVKTICRHWTSGDPRDGHKLCTTIGKNSPASSKDQRAGHSPSDCRFFSLEFAQLPRAE